MFPFPISRQAFELRRFLTFHVSHNSLRRIAVHRFLSRFCLFDNRPKCIPQHRGQKSHSRQ